MYQKTALQTGNVLIRVGDINHRRHRAVAARIVGATFTLPFAAIIPLRVSVYIPGRCPWVGPHKAAGCQRVCEGLLVVIVADGRDMGAFEEDL